MSSDSLSLVTWELECPAGLVQVTAEDHAKSHADHVLNRLDGSRKNFTENLFPSTKRENIPLLGSFKAHERVFSYHPVRSLKVVIENAINSMTPGRVEILAIYNRNTYSAYECGEFSYGYLSFLHEHTHAQDFVVFLENPDVFFGLFEDAPACYGSFFSISELELSFDSSKAMLQKVFSSEKWDWLITTYPQERKWLENFEQRLGAQRK